jgi:gliding motility-associated-like protein
MLLLLIAFSAKAQNYSNLELVENKGQWPAQVKFKAVTTTGAFYLQPDGYRMVLHNREDLQAMAEYFHGHSHSKKDSFVHAKSARVADELQIRSHAYDMKFLHANQNPEIVPDKPLSTYNNYFIGNDPKQWASFCRIFQGVTYKNVYPGVDVRYYTSEGKLKYDLIVNPGASVDKIAMYYDGVNGLEVRNERLVIKTSVDEVQELEPYTYQPLAAGRKEISNRYEVDGNIVRFKLGAYDKSKTLIIDPFLIFASFSGSTADNWGYTATFDKDGSFYGGGIVFGTGFPVNTGAYQTTFQGGIADEPNISAYDIGIIKFTPDGTNRVYATYVGGAGNEQPHSMICDEDGSLIIAGRTNSSGASGFPSTLPTFGTGGSYDIFIAKLNPSGSAIISRKFGGTAIDGINIRSKYTPPVTAESIRRNYGDDSRSEVILDAAGNIYLASCTQSLTTNGSAVMFPTTPGAFQPLPGGGFQDGVLIKTSGDISNVLFSSFLGGSGDEAGFVLSINPTNNNIYVAGGTTSTDFPKTNVGATLQTTNQGGIADGYIAIISNDGLNHVKSTYVGTSNTDIIYGIAFDISGFPYVMGTTAGTAAWPVTANVTFSQPNGKQFISKLQPDLSGFVYSTVFGKGNANPDISPVAFLVDRCENVYISGWGGSINSGYVPGQSTLGLPLKDQIPMQPSPDGSDFYYFVLERNARSQLFGSFFGASQGVNGDHVDGGTSRFDKNGVIYQAQCGFCNGGPNAFPTTPGSWSPQNRSTNCNLAAVKIAMNLAGVATGVKSFVDGNARKSGCIPLTVDFRDTLSLGTRYIWNFGDGSPDETTTTATISHTFQNIGSYTVRLVSIDSSTCNIADTSYTTITVRQDIATLNGRIEKLPPCEGMSYRLFNFSTPPAAPGKPFTNTSFKWDFGDGTSQVTGMGPVDHTYPAKGTYNVKLILIDTNYCNYPDTFNITLRISDNVKAQFTTPPSGCAPYDAVFNNTSVGGADYYWDFGDGTTSTAINPTHTYTVPNTYTIKLKAVDSNTCNKVDSTTFTIIVSGSPTALFDYSPKPPQVNTAVEYVNQSTGATSYLWKFGDGDSLFTVRRDTTVRHFYNATATFNSCLVAYNQYGCKDTFCVPIVARVVPALDVPNAFTPNGDGINDKVQVLGFGISRMNWRIYNRWGQLIFTTTNRNQGWDGRYKGVLQPQEVYTYTLDVEFSDGTKATKTGDITLLK